MSAACRYAHAGYASAVSKPAQPEDTRFPGCPSSLRDCGLALRLEARLQPIEDLIGPEALEAVQRLVQHGELIRRDATDLLHRAHVLLVERAHRLAHVAALLGRLDSNRAR